MSDNTHYDHPIPVGSVLEAPNYDCLYKVITDTRKSESGAYWVYESFEIGTAANPITRQTEMDFETMTGDNKYTDWELIHRNE